MYILDKSPYGSVVGGTAQNDTIDGNGLGRKTIVGGDGDDHISPGIVFSTNPRDRVTIYGDGVVGAEAGFPNNPLRLVYDAPGSIAHRNNFGDDVIAIGNLITGKGGGGEDTYVTHGGQDAGARRLFAIAMGFDVTKDTLVVDGSEDFRFSDFVMEEGSFRRYADGSKSINVREFTVHGDSENPIIGTEDQGRGQHVRVITHDIGHDPDFQIFRVRYDADENWRNAVREELYDSVGTGSGDFILV